MTLYVCQSDTPLAQGQACNSWVVQETPLDQLAITKADATTICGSIALMFVFAFIFSKLRSSI